MKYNILVTINSKYINHLKLLIYSILDSNPKDEIELFVFYRNLSKDERREIIDSIVNERCNVSLIKINENTLNFLPVYQKRYPLEIYFRIFATQYLPKELDRILYLDTDILVINSLKKLYTMDFENNYYIATTHIGKFLKRVNDVRLDLNKEDKYINTGVMLMNLKLLRKVDIKKEVTNFVENNKLKLILPDQDIISAIFGDKIKLVDSMIYNFGEREWGKYNIKNPQNPIDIKWIRKNTVIIHYYGKNKPWNDKYIGNLNIFYENMLKKYNQSLGN